MPVRPSASARSERTTTTHEGRGQPPVPPSLIPGGVCRGEKEGSRDRWDAWDTMASWLLRRS
jgi:hypothetical protein